MKPSQVVRCIDVTEYNSAGPKLTRCEMEADGA